MTFELFCATLIAVFFGLAVAFAGYRMFLVLLPIWGFFAGFAIGAQSIQLLTQGGFLADVTSWVVGFVVGALFAVLSYLFYAIAVAVLAGSVGYAIGVGFMGLIGISFGWLAWIVGIVVAVVLIVVTFMFNLQKWVIIIATSLGGAAAIVGSLGYGVGALTVMQNLVENPVQALMQNSFWWTLLFLVVAVGGFIVQYRSSRAFMLEAPPNRI
jgi:hypothetical protein